MLQISNMTVGLGGVVVLHEVSLAVEARSMAGLIGRNGAGKTTLLRAAMGLLPTVGGAVAIDGLDLTGQPAHRRAPLAVGYMPEDRRLAPQLSAEDNIMIPAWSTRLPDAAERMRWIESMIPEIAEFRDRPASALSGGQQKLVALARALMVGRRLLLLDEPTEGIAPVLARRMGEILSDLKRAGVSVLVAESNEAHLAGLLDAIYVIERGRVSRKMSSPA